MSGLFTRGRTVDNAELPCRFLSLSQAQARGQNPVFGPYWIRIAGASSKNQCWYIIVAIVAKILGGDFKSPDHACVERGGAIGIGG